MTQIGRDGGLVRGSLGDRDVAERARGAARDGAERDGRFHWSDAGGLRCAHWFDRAHGYDWFGFYGAQAFYWSLYWNDYFWWYDAQYGRWLWYYDGQWFWESPDGTLYAYEGDGYFQWDETSGGVVLVPSQPGDPGDAAQPSFYYSSDGTRLVQVDGEERSAYLYDMTRQDADGNGVLLGVLSQNVAQVEFSDTSNDYPLVITLDIQDPEAGSYRLTFDADGNGMDGASAKELHSGVAPSSAQAKSQVRTQAAIRAGLDALGAGGMDTSAFGD